MDHAQTITAAFAGANLAPREVSTRHVRSGLALAALLLAACVLPKFAFADGENVAKNPLIAGFKQGLGAKRSNIVQMLRTGEIPDAAAAAEFKEYFQRYALVLVILPGKDFNKERRLLKTTYFNNPGASNPARNLLNGIAFDFMKQAAGSKDLPLDIQYSAMLVIADLDEFEGRPPKALPATLPFLLRIVKSPAVPDAFKVVSLLGIKNHAESNSTYAIDPTVKAELNKTMLDLVTGKPPENRSPEGHQWLRRMAIEILGIMGDVDTKDAKNGVARALDRIVTSADESLKIRCAAAQALGGLKFAANYAEFKTVTTDLGALLVDVCTQELATAKQKDETPSRRRLDYLVQTVRDGLAGPGGSNPGKLPRLTNTATKSEDKQYVDLINKKTIDLIKSIETASDSGLAAAIEESSDKLKESLLSRPALAPAEKSGGGRPEAARADTGRRFPVAN